MADNIGYIDGNIMGQPNLPAAKIHVRSARCARATKFETSLSLRASHNSRLETAIDKLSMLCNLNEKKRGVLNFVNERGTICQ